MFSSDSLYLKDIILLKNNGTHTSRLLGDSSGDTKHQLHRVLAKKSRDSRSEKTKSKSEGKSHVKNKQTNEYLEKRWSEEQERLGTHLKSNLLMFQRTMRREIIRILSPNVVGNVRDRPSTIVHLRMHRW